MRRKLFNVLICSVIVLSSCKDYIKDVQTDYSYQNITISNQVNDSLVAVLNEEFIQYGSDVAYLSCSGDTIIPFGKYGYLGTDTLIYFAQVFSKSSTEGKFRWVGIYHNCNIIFDLVNFDNAPDQFYEGFIRIKRNNKYGFANLKGEIIIPCEYDYAWWFEDGKANVYPNAKFYIDKYDGHKRVEANNWFYIDKQGNKIN